MRKKWLAALLAALCLVCQASAQLEPNRAFLLYRLDTFSTFTPDGSYTRLSGAVGGTEPIDRLEAVLYDLRLMTELNRYVWTPAEGEETHFLTLENVRRHLLGWDNPGEKRLVITVEIGGESIVLFDREFYRAGDCAAPRNISERCVYLCGECRPRYLYDNAARTRWTPAKGEDILTIELPDDAETAGLQIWWSETPERASVTFLDANGDAIGEAARGGDSFTPAIDWIDAPDGARSLTLSVTGASVEEAQVYERGWVPPMVQKWRETSDTWELMVVSTHQDDEHIFFGGILPLYTQLGREVGMVYMVNCGERRYKEALTGLWSVGVDNYPEFIGLRDGMPDDPTEGKWGGQEHYVGLLVEQIRKHRPEVVLTHDFRGEYGHNQHIATANAVVLAVEAAADPERYPESAERYGVWQAKKLYIHLWGEDVTDFDWDQPIPGYGGMSAYDISRRAYDKHRSQQQYVPYNMGIAADNSRFGLYSSAVGPDEAHNDLFEHIEPGK